MNKIRATILYDGSYAKTQCENCGYIMSRHYRTFPSTGGSFSIAACNQDCAEAAYILLDPHKIIKRVTQDRNCIT